MKMYPGGIKLSRTMGSAESKIKELGGNNNIVTSDPEITSFELKAEHDFLLLGSNGIFNQFTNSSVSECLWKVFDSKEHKAGMNIHSLTGMASESVLKNVLL